MKTFFCGMPSQAESEYHAIVLEDTKQLSNFFIRLFNDRARDLEWIYSLTRNLIKLVVNLLRAMINTNFLFLQSLQCGETIYYLLMLNLKDKEGVGLKIPLKNISKINLSHLLLGIALYFFNPMGVNKLH